MRQTTLVYIGIVVFQFCFCLCSYYEKKANLLNDLNHGYYVCEAGGNQIRYRYGAKNNILSRFNNSCIETILDKKWLVFMGDSSLRMMYDYLTLRLLGKDRMYPSNIDHHGPAKPFFCGGDSVGCTYEFYINGIRLTFIWHHKPDLPHDTLRTLLQTTLGFPDLFIFTLGAWDNGIFKNSTTDYIKNLVNITKPPTTEYDKIFASAWKSSINTLKIWASMCSCDHLDSGILKNEILHMEQAGALLKDKEDWMVFDRSVFRRAKNLSQQCQKQMRNSCRYQRHHPVDELLSIDLDMLTLLLADENNLCINNT